MRNRRASGFVRSLLRRLGSSLGAVLLTLGFFLVLPLMQAISKPPSTDRIVRNVATADLPPPRSVQRGWSLITLDAVMAWDVTGVLAAVTAPLAAAGIPIAAVTAFSRDHLLVPWDRLDDALAALAGLCGQVRFLD